jgi:acyl-CoA synthetase (AMP-forming)/AMP-acid ligase II
LNLGYLINNAVARFSHHVAAYDATRQFTFAQLNARANRLGNALALLGIRHQDRIASLQYNGVETLEFDVMAAKFGYVRALLNARNSVAENIDALNLVRASALVFGAEFADQIGEIRRSVPTLRALACVGGSTPAAEEYETLLARTSANEPGYAVTEADWHSIYFTSGTTGKPKGIVLSQANWLAVVRNHLIDTYATSDPSDILLHAAPMSHATGSLILAHLVRGARQTFVRRFDALEVLEKFRRDRVTTIWLAPTMWSKMVDEIDRGGADLSSARSIRFGGGPIPVHRLRDAVERWGPVFCSGWGQWEAPQQCTVFSQRDVAAAVADKDGPRIGSAGRPMTYCKVGIADDDNRLLPPGEPGEVVVAGDHLMVGYLDQPEETAGLRFGEWQRTGDIGHLDADGYLYLTDRKRDVIRSGASNVFPRHVEEILYAHPAILEAAAVGVPDETWGESVHVVVVLRENATLDAEVLLAWCRERLPSNKRPRSVDFVAELPKNTYGKILRRDVRGWYWKSDNKIV